MEPTTAQPLRLATPNPTPTAPAPSNRHRDWADETRVNETPRGRLLSMVADLLLLAAVTGVDLILIKSTLDHALRLPEAYSWAAAAGLTIASATLAFRCGSQTQIAQATGQSTAGTIAITTLALAWLAVGVGLFWLRWNAAGFTPAAAQYDAAGTTSTADRQDATEKLLAVVLATIYLATGALAWLDGHKLTNHAATALRRTRRQLTRVNRLVAEKTARVTRLAENRTIHQHDLNSIETHRATARAARRGLAVELKEHARLQIALNLGDPEATGLVHDRPAPTGGEPS